MAGLLLPMVLIMIIRLLVTQQKKAFKILNITGHHKWNGIYNK
jgi:hypothetical protein